MGLGFAMSYRNSIWIIGLVTALLCSTTSKDVRFPYPQAKSFSISGDLPQWRQDFLNTLTLRKYAQFKRRYVQRDTSLNKTVYIRSPRLLPDNSIAYTDAAVHCQSMILFALMAGADSESKVLFDGMFFFYKKNTLRKNSLRMKPYIGDTNPVVEAGYYSADLDLAYALLLAHGQWGSDGEIAYLTEAKKILAESICTGAIDGETKRIAIPEKQGLGQSCVGDWRPSYLRAFYATTGDSLFLTVADSLYAAHKMVTQQHSSTLVPTYIEGAPARACGDNFALNAGHFGNEALLYPLHLALDYVHFESPDAKSACEKMWQWVDEQYIRDTTLPYAAYRLDGKPLTSYSSLQSVASFATTALTCETPTPLISELLLYLQSHNGIDAKSHGVQILSLLLLSGNWWSPVEALKESAVASNSRLLRPDIAIHGHTIKAEGLPGKNAFLSIYSLQGELLYKKSVEILKRTLTQELSYTTLSEGFALLQLEGDGYTVLEKFFVSP